MLGLWDSIKPLAVVTLVLDVFSVSVYQSAPHNRTIVRYPSLPGSDRRKIDEALLQREVNSQLWEKGTATPQSASNSTSSDPKATSTTLSSSSAIISLSAESSPTSLTEGPPKSTSNLTEYSSTTHYSSSATTSLSAGSNSTSLTDIHVSRYASSHLGTTVNPTGNSSNHSSPTKGSFSFIIPYGTSQSCNIFGPTCQPGSITVQAIDRKDGTSLVTLPCSSYLASQSTYLYENRQRDAEDLGEGDKLYYSLLPQGWVPQLLNSPECMSYRALAEKYVDKPWTFTECRDGNSVGTPHTLPWGGELLPPQVPPSWFDGSNGATFFSFCCDSNCLPLDLIGNVRLYYFQPEGPEHHCNSRGLTFAGSDQKTVTSSEGSQQSHGGLEKRLLSSERNVAGIMTAVVSGYTLTSPSVYLEFLGTARAEPGCGLHSELTSPFLAVPASDLSTFSMSSFSIGQSIDGWFMTGQHGVHRSYAPLNLADITCSTFGVGKSPDGDLTIGPPWLPLFLPPKSMYPLGSSLTTVFTACSSDNVVIPLYDPPIVLNPRGDLVASPTAAEPPFQTSEKPAPIRHHSPLQPGHGLVENQPASTEPPSPSKGVSKTQSQPITPTQRPGSEDDPHINEHNAGPDGSKNQATGASIGSRLGADNANGEKPDVGNGVRQDSQEKYNPEKNTSPFKKEQDPPMQHGNEPHSAISNTNPTPVSGTKAAAPQLPVFAAGGHQFSADRSGFVVAGISVSPGGPAAVISGTPVALGPSGKLVVGSQTMSLASSAHDSPPLVLNVGDHSITPNPLGFVAAGKTIKPGGAPVTIAGTPIVLGSSNGLVVGSQTISLPLSTGGPTPAILTFGDQTITPDPSGFVIAGKTMSPGDAPFTLSGTRISLDRSSHLVIGSQTILLPPATVGSDPTPGPLNIAGQTITPNPTGFVIAGTTLLPHGPPITVSGTRASLGPSGVLLVGSQTISLPLLTGSDRHPVPTLVTIAGQTITPDSTGLAIAGTTLFPGGPPLTLSGTRVSLGTAGQLIIGSSTISLSMPTTLPGPTASVAGNDVIAIAGQTITANPIGFFIDGSVVVPGGSSIVVKGTTIDLGTDGVLHVGTSSITLASVPNGTKPPGGDPPASALPFTSHSRDRTIENRIAVVLAVISLAIQSLVGLVT